MMKKIDTDVSNLKQGLHPQNLSFWYDKIIRETIEMAPPWLEDKIKNALRTSFCIQLSLK